MIRILTLLAVLGCVNAVWAASDWGRVTGLGPHTAVRVKTFDGVTHRGELQSADADVLRIDRAGQEVNLSRADVMRVEVRVPFRRLRNMLIGAGIGVAVGVVAAFATCPSCAGETSSEEFHRRLALGGVAGASIGAGLAAIGAPYKTVYRAKRSRR